MSRKSKIDPTLKVKLVERYLAGEISKAEAARLAGVDKQDTFNRWFIIYKNEGPTGLLDQRHNRNYSVELKSAAIQAYLSGDGSLKDIAEKFQLRSETQLQNWIKEYNTHGEIRSRESGGGSYMRKSRQTTPEERLEIVQDCLANDTEIIIKLKFQLAKETDIPKAESEENKSEDALCRHRRLHDRHGNMIEGVEFL